MKANIPVTKKHNHLLGLWFVNLIIPGIAFLRKGAKRSTIAIGIITVTIFLTIYGAIAYFYFFKDIKELALTFLSNSNLILYGTYSLYIFAGIYLLAVLSGTIYIVNKAEWNSLKKAFLILITTILIGTVTATSIWGATTLNDIRSTLLTVLQEPNQNITSDTTVTKPVDNIKPWGNSSRINIMILGSDQGNDRIGIRPDILMVASINTKDGTTELFNIPRNLENVRFPAGTPAAEEFPDGFNDLINGVWTWASDNPDFYPNNANPGLQATQDALSETLGLKIDYSMTINMQGFSDLVTSLGGVTLNVPRDLPKGKTGDIDPPVLEAGQNKLLNGDDALWFVRSRADSNDYDRMLRQRCMVNAITEKMSGDKILFALPSLLKNLRDNFSTNIQQQDMKAWTELFDKIKQTEIQGYAFTEDVIDVSDPDWDYIKQKVQESITTAPVAETTPKPQSTLAPQPIIEPVTPTPMPTPVKETQQTNPYC